MTTLRIENWVRTRQDSVHTAFRDIVSKFSVADSLDLSPIQFTPRTPTRQDSLVLSVSAVWTSHNGDVLTFSEQVMGLAVLRNKLYSVYHTSSEVFIHSTKEKFIRLSHPKIDGLTWPRGIAASQRHRCVFIADWYRTFGGKVWRATENIKQVRL